MWFLFKKKDNYILLNILYKLLRPFSYFTSVISFLRVEILFTVRVCCLGFIVHRVLNKNRVLCVFSANREEGYCSSGNAIFDFEISSYMSFFIFWNTFKPKLFAQNLTTFFLLIKKKTKTSASFPISPESLVTIQLCNAQNPNYISYFINNYSHEMIGKVENLQIE